ncbi:MAG: GDSL-type esterase/lipase family protein [Rikenellaceae bacterium]|nr:GDSL-type esterase/lipase family protein [Rikenellaceae bacterium]
MKNYIRYAFGLAVLVVLMTLGLAYIPANLVERAGLKPVDILADLNRDNTVENLDQLDAEVGADTRQGGYSVRSVTSPDTVASAAGDSSRAVSTIFVEPEPAAAEDSTESVEAPAPAQADTIPSAPVQEGSVIPIRDYSPGGAMLRTFANKLANVGSMRRPLRIGFMGDSFIEGDLLTSDFRELMQNRYGGGGVGFVPITSQVAGFRQTVGHKFGKWKQSSIVNSKGNGFTISAFNYTPSEDSYVEYKGSSNKKHLDRFGRSRLLFVSKGRSVIRATVNGEEEFLFNTDPMETLQEVQLDGDFRSIRYQVSDVEGFTAYGVFLENPTGVSVDNFSVRGNPGTVMGRINPALSEQFGKLSPYDLIILQYGLNVVSSGVTDYSTYRKQMTAVVNHIKRCFPGVAILVMSVGDRATRSNGTFVTMPGIRAMVQTQELVARDCGVLFWNTYDAMRAAGGMGTFVKNGWAAKDYTHISARGGRKIGTALYDAVTAAAAQ